MMMHRRLSGNYKGRLKANNADYPDELPQISDQALSPEASKGVEENNRFGDRRLSYVHRGDAHISTNES